MYTYAILAMDPVVGCDLLSVKFLYLLQLRVSLCLHCDGRLQLRRHGQVDSRTSDGLN